MWEKLIRILKLLLKLIYFVLTVNQYPEIEVIDSIAEKLKKVATIALRINPYIEAHTHKYITTGIAESKFGINTWELEEVLGKLSITE